MASVLYINKRITAPLFFRSTGRSIRARYITPRMAGTRPSATIKRARQPKRWAQAREMLLKTAHLRRAEEKRRLVKNTTRSACQQTTRKTGPRFPLVLMYAHRHRKNLGVYIYAWPRYMWNGSFNAAREREREKGEFSLFNSFPKQFVVARASN